MTRHIAAPMPESIRHFMRAGQHPARSTTCPWCHAGAHKPCVIRSSGTPSVNVHHSRKDAWARLTACCTTCQVAPGVPCHKDGRELDGGAVHAVRHSEAEATAA
ncbi:zinc finger domain-containing protein [Streptomyces sp. NBC_01498]|uniref:zinc finger domain-containing protein n=1 Tax=Streptomyces sp. NBC_01498 TaxID=2975870 RepID=UPI003FCE0FC3